MPLNPDAKLNPSLFEGVEQRPTRDGYGEGLVLAGEGNPNVVALSADLTESTRAEGFAHKFPERFFETGVAEQNMSTIAAGLGVSGKIPFISSYATFSPGRNWEQIRTTIAYNDSNVKIAGHHAGVSVGPDGATHQALEDLAIMRAMPNMRVFVPCDAVEAKKATCAAAHIWGPIYSRFGREKTPVITTEETPYVPGRTEIFWDSEKPKVLILACGPLVYEALLAAKELEKERTQVRVVNVHTLKPLDERISHWAEKIGAVVTVEEHQANGGLGGAVAELLAKHSPVPMEFVGVPDSFGESGEPEQLLEHFGLNARHIKAAVKRVLKRAK